MLIKTDPPKTTVSDTELLSIKEEKHIQIQRYLQQRKIVAEKKSVRNCGHSCKETEKNAKKKSRSTDRRRRTKKKEPNWFAISRRHLATTATTRRNSCWIHSLVCPSSSSWSFFRCFGVCERSLLSRCLCLVVLSRSAKVGDYVWLCVCVCLRKRVWRRKAGLKNRVRRLEDLRNSLRDLLSGI